MKTQYSKIAKEYTRLQKDRVERRYVYEPTLFHHIGNITDLNVADLGSGSGLLTRKLALQEPALLVGIDKDSEILKLAREEEKRNPLGINYIEADLTKTSLEIMRNYRVHDVAVAGFLLHYAKTRTELRGMCRNIYDMLVPDGRFITINTNPEYPLKSQKQLFMVTTKARLPLHEGSPIKVYLWENETKHCPPFTIYHWRTKTYDSALKNAGFKDIKWHPMQISPGGIKRFGKDFQKEWNREPYLCILEARK